MLTKTFFLITALAAGVLAAPAVNEERSTSLVPGVKWSVKNFVRPCNYTACAYDFTIQIVPDQGSVTNVPCSFLDTTGSAPSTHSNFTYNCGANAPTWTANWGYNKDGDFSVLTVVNTQLNWDAYFGYAGVAAATSFPDEGPETVYVVGTFT